MARLRQIYPGQYTSSGNISAEFEALVRYLNSAELGNKTVAELLKQLFDEEGNFDGPIEFRFDGATGLEYRIGEYTSGEEGWTLLADAASIRGTPGVIAGDIGAPIFQGRVDYLATAGQTEFNYAHEITDDILLYRNGLLLRLTLDYTTNPVGGAGFGSVTLTAPAAINDRITIFKVRANEVTAYTRSDVLTVAPQSSFIFNQPEGSSPIVYKNGILQREGVGNDYIAVPAANQINFIAAVPSGTTVSILNIQNSAKSAVTGLMLEEAFCDPATGLILFDRIVINSGAITADKVAGLTALLSSAARITSSTSSPVSPSVGNFWLDLTPTPAQLKFWDGSQWLRTSPATAVPAFTASNALQFVQVNGSGTAFQYGTPDLSGLVPLTQRGAASGVATLDTNARLPIAQLPLNVNRRTISSILTGAQANGARTLQRIYRESVALDAIAVRLTSGTCSIQLTVDGAPTGPVLAASSTINQIRFGLAGNTDIPIVVDASGVSRVIGFVITASASAVDIDIAVGLTVNP
jgi:hypothetical protein